LKRKNKHALIRKFNPTLNEKHYHHPTFVQYKKNYHQFIFSLPHEKKNKKKEKKIKVMGPAGVVPKKNSRGKKIKILILNKEKK
jgi:hypothetical protein